MSESFNDKAAWDYGYGAGSDYRGDPQDGFSADELAAYEAEMDALAAEADEEDWDEFADYCDDMDGDFDTAMRDAGWGTDEDYGYYGYEEDF
jgi:hypothetical protein